jgi:hypothetical protein
MRIVPLKRPGRARRLGDNPRMAPTAQALLTQPERFAVIEDIEHAAIGAVIGKYLKVLTPVTIGYVLVLMAVVLAMVYALFSGVVGSSLWAAVQPMIGLAVGAFVLLPVHELIHVACYKACGARDASVAFDRQQMTALAVADGFVATGSQFYWIAAMPSLMLCSLLGIGAVLLPSQSPLLFGAIAAHWFISVGDWALINLTWLNRDAQVYTFDDVAAKRTYFFRRSLVSADVKNGQL